MFVMIQYYVYLLTNYTNTVLYTGATNDLGRRLQEHRSDSSEKSFTKRYRVYKLVYYEVFYIMQSALAREHQIKSWSRARKDELVISMNPEWKDLAVTSHE
jgi:putative endonuclease